MNDEFITKGIEENRYLKAAQLVEHFETEIRRELERVGDQIVEENRELFVDGVEANWNKLRSSRTIVAFARVDYVMDRVNHVGEDASNLKLNLSFRWMEPAKLGHHDDDGVMSLASYKIKNVEKEDYRRVKEQTREEDWPIRFAKDHFDNARGIFYIPVETAEELTMAHETLKEHFAEYGPMYGVESA